MKNFLSSLILILLSFEAFSQLTCLDFSSKQYTNKKNEVTSEGYLYEYEYSEKMTSEQTDEFEITMSTDSSYKFVVISESSSKSTKVVIVDKKGDIIEEAEKKGNQQSFYFEAPKEELYKIILFSDSKTPSCTFLGIGVKFKEK